jgi:hypothetical protein
LVFNPWIINRNWDVWGDDSYGFGPETRLRGAAESEEGLVRWLRVVNDTELSLEGAGSRNGIGKHFGLM